MALDYEKYPILGREPNTLHEHYRCDPRGAKSYPEWVEDRIWEILFGRYGHVQMHFRGEWVNIHEGRACELIQYGAEYADVPRGSTWRAVLYDGTIIKEWPSKTKES